MMGPSSALSEQVTPWEARRKNAAAFAIENVFIVTLFFPLLKGLICWSSLPSSLALFLLYLSVALSRDCFGLILHLVPAAA